MADVPGYIRRNEYLKKILSETVRILSFRQGGCVRALAVIPLQDQDARGADLGPTASVRASGAVGVCLEK